MDLTDREYSNQRRNGVQLHLKPELFSKFVESSLCELSSPFALEAMVSSKVKSVIEYQQLRLLNETGAYNTDCFYWNNFGYASSASPEFILSQSTVRETLTTTTNELPNKHSVEFEGLTFERTDHLNLAELMEGVTTGIIDTAIKLELKPHLKVRSLLDLPTNKVNLDDVLCVGLSISLYDKDLNVVADQFQKLVDKALAIGLTAKNPLQDQKVSFKSRLLGMFSGEKKLKRYSPIDYDIGHQCAVLAKNWFIPMTVLDSVPVSPFFKEFSPVNLRTKHQEELLWSPFNSPGNYNVMAVPLDSEGKALHSLLEKLALQNAESDSVGVMAFVPIEDYPRLEKFKEPVFVDGEYLVSFDLLPLLTQEFESEYLDTELSELMTSYLYLLALTGLGSEGAKESTQKVVWALILDVVETYIKKQEICTTLHLLQVLSNSGNSDLVELSECISTIPGLIAILDTSKKSIFDTKNHLVIDSSEFRSDEIRNLLSVFIPISIYATSNINQFVRAQVRPELMLNDNLIDDQKQAVLSRLTRRFRKCGISFIDVDKGKNLDPDHLKAKNASISLVGTANGVSISYTSATEVKDEHIMKVNE